MRPLSIVTWNVLHRVHAVNWKEPPAAAHPDERVRIEGVSQAIARWIEGEVDVVCLQEASGDQLESVRRVVGARARVCSHRYPRVPRRRDGGPAELADPSEHLVVIAKSPSAKIAAARTFDDPGKGMLVVALDDEVTVIATHVSFGDRRTAQLAQIVAAARASQGVTIVVGDFNVGVEIVRGAFGEPVAITALPPERPTRIQNGDHGGVTIDHVVVVGASIEAAEVLDAAGLSDHHPVFARVA